MNRSGINFIIDALMMLAMMAIAGIGLLIKYVLIPGKDRWDIYGRNVELYFWQMDRHEWGTIHLIIGIVLLALLILHLILHWNMICSMYRNLISGSITRTMITVLFIAACIILIAFPILVKPGVEDLKRGEGHQRHSEIRGCGNELVCSNL